MDEPTKSAEPIPNDEGKSTEYKVGYKKPPISTRFKKGQSGNPKGRPKDFNAVRRLAQAIAVEVIPGESNVDQWTRVEAILRDWASLKSDRQAQKDFLEIAYGKVPNQLEIAATIKTCDVTLDDTERLARLASIFDAARTRRDRPADSGTGPGNLDNPELLHTGD
jgi:hypothetical protein